MPLENLFPNFTIYIITQKKSIVNSFLKIFSFISIKNTPFSRFFAYNQRAC